MRFTKSRVFIAVLFFVLGALIFAGIRVAKYKPEEAVHYHANFAVYINDQREQFKAVNYYEETSTTTCSSTETEPEDTPMSRTHMHAGVNDVVHIEDKRVSWGNFFTVLGWNVGKTYIATRDNIYQNNDQSKVTYMLNGKRVDSIANLVIGDQDKLLINYGGQSPDQISQEYSTIKNNALKADQSKDPAACGANSKTIKLSDRIKHIFN